MSNETANSYNEATPPPTPAPVKLCDYNQVVSPELDQLLVTAPQNPYVRTLLHNRVLQPIPEEIKTYADIKAWVEFNIDPAKIKPTEEGKPLAQAQAIFHVRPEDGPYLAVTVEYREQSYGTCRYYQNRIGRDDYQVSTRELRRLADGYDGEDDWEDFCDDVRSHLAEACNENQPETEDTGDETTDEHEQHEESPEHQSTAVQCDLSDVLRRFITHHGLDDLIEKFEL